MEDDVFLGMVMSSRRIIIMGWGDVKTWAGGGVIGSRSKPV